MPKKKLTAAAVSRLKAPSEGQIDYFDAAYPGLALRVTSNDVRSWVYFGRLYRKLKRVTLGRFPDLGLLDARTAAGEAADAMRAGRDPTKDRKAARRAMEKDTVEANTTDWLKRDQSDNRSHDAVKRVVEKHLLPEWRDRPITSITRRDCIELIDGIEDRHSTSVARGAYSHLHRFFEWCIERSVLSVNPMAKLPKPGKAIHRDRVLSDPELFEIWRAADAMKYPFGDATKLLILTAARRDEISALIRAEIKSDGDRSAIKLDGERTKNKTPHTIPLSPSAAEIIEGLPQVRPPKGKPSYLFTTTGETPVSGWSKAKRHIDAKIVELRKSDATEAGGDPEEVKPLADWRLHDLRRTAATGMQRLGIRLEVIEAALNHLSGSRSGLVAVYQRHAFEDEKRIALEAWATYVTTLKAEAPAPTNVASMHEHKRNRRQGNQG